MRMLRPRMQSCNMVATCRPGRFSANRILGVFLGLGGHDLQLWRIEPRTSPAGCATPCVTSPPALLWDLALSWRAPSAPEQLLSGGRVSIPLRRVESTAGTTHSHQSAVLMFSWPTPSAISAEMTSRHFGALISNALRRASRTLARNSRLT